MAEQYLTRRERREAERRAAEAEAAAQHSAEVPDDDYSSDYQAPAKLTVKPQASAASETPYSERESNWRAGGSTPTTGTAPARSEAPSLPEARFGQHEDQHFQTRAERRQYMIDHGLNPTPVYADQDDADQGLRTNTSSFAEPAAQPQPGAYSDKGSAPVVRTTPASVAPSSPAVTRAYAPSSSAEAHRLGETAPKISGAVDRANESPKADDWVARRQAASKPRERRAPVVKPTNPGITVVSAASAPTAGSATKDIANLGTSTLGTSTRVNYQPSTEKQQPSPDLRNEASGPATMPLESVKISPEESQTLQADEGEEVDNPPVGPMKARDVTYGDGEILVGDRPSVLPYIVLGVGGLVAIVLIIVALIMLF